MTSEVTGSGGATPTYNAGLRFWEPVQGVENQVKLLGGQIKPAGTAAPTIPTPGRSFWSVARLGVGRFLITLLGNVGAWTAASATTKGKLMVVLAGVQIDSAGSDQTLKATATAMTASTFEIDVTDTTTGALTDISQPGTPNGQGSFINWLAMVSNDNTQTLNLPALATGPNQDNP